MGPELMYAALAISAGATAYSAVSSKQTADAEADAAEQRSQIEGLWAKRRADEEHVTAQRIAGEEIRKAKLASGALESRVGASGSSSSDPTVLNLMGQIGKEGQYNAEQATAGGDQKAASINYQSSLDRWSTNTNADLRRWGGNRTLIGGLMSAAGTAGTGWANASRMAQRYGDGSVSSRAGSTGYGG